MNDDLRPAYDLRALLPDSVRGRYALRYRTGTSLVLLNPDVIQSWPGQETDNEAGPVGDATDQVAPPVTN